MASPDTIDRLSVILKKFNALHRADGSMASSLANLRAELKALAEEALKSDRETLPIVVSFVHVLVDCCRGAVSGDIASKALEGLEDHLSAEPLQDCVLSGDMIGVDSSARGSDSCSLLRWETFCDHYADKFGLPKKNPDALKKLWARIEAGEVDVPEEEVHLTGANGVVWFTDEAELRQACSTSNGADQIDGTSAYDMLALDWSNRWETTIEEEGGSAKAVLLSVPLRWRRAAERGLRIPTALDAWGFLTFAPAEDSAGGTWPSVPSVTINPVTGEAGLPEGIHGPLEVPRGERCSVEACSDVSKIVSDRIDESGDVILQRALKRLNIV